MYNPDGSDNNKEFIEIYSDDINDFSGYLIEDSISNDILNRTKSANNSYSLIVEDGFDYSNIDASVYTIGATIGNGLNNDNDIIILRDNESKIIDVFSYSKDFGGDDNGKSLERISINDLSNRFDNWKESNPNGGTPGYENSILEINFNDLVINEFLPNPFGEDDANAPDGEWIEIYNNLDDDINLEGFILEDDFGHKLTISNSNTNPLLIKENEFAIVYLNAASGFLNNDGFEKIKLLYGNKIIDEVSYTDSKEGLSWAKINNLWKILTPSPSQQNIDEPSNKGVSSIKIVKIYTGKDESVTFGDNFEVRLEIYKGNTSKNAINIWAENDDGKISKVTNFNIYGKFINYTINVPLTLNPNCNSKFKDGDYIIKVEGLDSEDKEDLEVMGLDKKFCNIKETKENKQVSKDVNTETLLNEENEVDSEISQNNNVQGNIVYESSDIKAKNSVSYILIITLLLIIGLILFRKDL